MELLIGICRSDPNFFEVHKDRIQVAIGARWADSAKVLDGPFVYALEHGARLKGPKAGIQKEKYSKLVKIVLGARSLSQLLKEGVDLPQSVRRRWLLQCGDIDQDLETGKQFYARRLNAVKVEKWNFDQQRDWTIDMCRYQGVTLMQPQEDGMIKALDAVYRYQEKVWRMSDGNFKPEKNVNDWLDYNQLFYLADPLMHFFTEERKIKVRCEQSEQSQRILILDEFLKANGIPF